MKPLLFEVTQVGTGTLCIMPKPDGNYLPQAITHFRLLGIDNVVCLLETHELAEFKLTQEAELCANAELSFTHFPIPDSQIPADVTAFHHLVTELHTALCAGANITIHCRAGIGRTGIVAGAILLRDGHDLQTALAMLSHARGFPIPETQAQYDFLRDYTP